MVGFIDRIRILNFRTGAVSGGLVSQQLSMSLIPHELTQGSLERKQKEKEEEEENWEEAKRIKRKEAEEKKR